MMLLQEANRKEFGREQHHLIGHRHSVDGCGNHGGIGHNGGIWFAHKEVDSNFPNVVGMIGITRVVLSVSQWWLVAHRSRTLRRVMVDCSGTVSQLSQLLFCCSYEFVKSGG
jgi:hypothetical protein